jgi:hypothetical protein
VRFAGLRTPAGRDIGAHQNFSDGAEIAQEVRMARLWVHELRYALARRDGGRADTASAARVTDRGRRPRGFVEPLERRALLASSPVAVGGEFRVNTNTAGSQELFSEAPHAVAFDAAGDFVVAWSSAGQDGSSWGVYAQRYAADGTRRGGEFRVNEATANAQWYPAVGCADGGAFVVAWTSELQDGSGDAVYARRYDAAGAPAGNEFRVNTTTADHQRQPTVAVDASGDFVVAWSGYGQAGGAGWDVYAQRFDSAGAKRGGEFRVNGTTTGSQQFAAVAAADDGRFVVAWTADGQDGSGTGVYGRRYDAAGAALGGEFRINTETVGSQQYARVAAAGAGDFVVAWASVGQDGSARGVYAQRYAADGTRRGGEFRVNQVVAGEQFAPTIAADAAGGFVVTWTGAQDGDQFGVYARAYDTAGGARGDEFRVNTRVTGNQVYSATASAPDGAAVIVWQSDGQDGSLFGVYGQRYAAPDTVAPTADVFDVSPDPRVVPVDSATIRFSEPVTGFTAADLRLTRDGSALNLLTTLQVLSSTDGTSFTLSNLAAITAVPGTYTLRVVAAGSGIADAAGNALAADASDTWTVAPAARVVGRYVFYNGSSFDGNGNAAGPADDDAIAPDKQALLPGAAAGFANYTSYPRGLNGVMVDIAGRAAGAAALVAGDFTCRVGNALDTAVWEPAPQVRIGGRPGAGAGGSDRVTLIWDDGAIVSRWLQVTVPAGAATWLAAPDGFYFGNLPGETGDAEGSAEVTGADFFRTRAAVGDGPATLTCRFDHDRNGRVDVRDLAVVRAGAGGPPLQLFGALPPSEAAPATAWRRDYRPPTADLRLAFRDDPGQ